jgi:hypothetical protein
MEAKIWRKLVLEELDPAMSDRTTRRFSSDVWKVLLALTISGLAPPSSTIAQAQLFVSGTVTDAAKQPVAKAMVGAGTHA